MRFFRKSNGHKEATPVWSLGVCSVAWIDDGEQIIDGIRVEFAKPGWAWTVLRDDLPIGEGWLVESGPAETREEALEIGLHKVREHQRALA